MGCRQSKAENAALAEEAPQPAQPIVLKPQHEAVTPAAASVAVRKHDNSLESHRMRTIPHEYAEPLGMDPDDIPRPVPRAAPQAQAKTMSASEIMAARPRQQSRPLRPLESRPEKPTKPPVSKYRAARDDRALMLLREEELVRGEREIRARISDPAAARAAIDEFRRNYDSGRKVKSQMAPDAEVRLRSQKTSPLSGPPNAEARREMYKPAVDNEPFVGYDVLRWD